MRLGQDIPFRPNDGVSTKPGELHAPTVAVPLTQTAAESIHQRLIVSGNAGRTLVTWEAGSYLERPETEGDRPWK